LLNADLFELSIFLHIGDFGDESFQCITRTGTDNLTRATTIKIERDDHDDDNDDDDDDIITEMERSTFRPTHRDYETVGDYSVVPSVDCTNLHKLMQHNHQSDPIERQKHT